MKKGTVITLVGCGLVWTSGLMAGALIKDHQDQKKYDDLDRAVCTLVSMYKDGVKFNEVDIEFLREHGFDDRYMFR